MGDGMSEEKMIVVENYQELDQLKLVVAGLIMGVVDQCISSFGLGSNKKEMLRMLSDSLNFLIREQDKIEESCNE